MIRRGDIVRVLRNASNALHPDGVSVLQKGDCVKVHLVDGGRIYFLVGNSGVDIDGISIKDVERTNVEKVSRMIGPGDRVRILRNGVQAHVPFEYGYLKPGDIVVVHHVENALLYYSLGSINAGSFNHIPLQDVELITCFTINSNLELLIADLP